MAKPRKIIPGGVDEYIARCPKEVQGQLKKVRGAIKEVAPDAIETVSYFNWPGYCYQDNDYNYNGMFAWFDYKKPYIRLQVRPPVVHDHQSELSGIKTSIAAVSFPEDSNISMNLVKKLVKASIDVMKASSKS